MRSLNSRIRCAGLCWTLAGLFALAILTAGAAEQGEPPTSETTAAAPADAPKPPEEVLPPVTGFMLHYNFDAGGNVQPDPMNKGEDWHVSDFYGKGKVRVEDGVLHLEKGNDLTGVTWRGPVVRKNYEITLDAMREAGDDFFCGLTFPVGEDPCSLILGGWGGSLVGLSSIDYEDAANNTTARMITFENGRWYRVRVRVYGEKIEAWLDEEKIVDVVTTGHQIGIRWEVEPSIPLGIATWRTTGAIRNVVMRTLTSQPFDYEVKDGR